MIRVCICPTSRATLHDQNEYHCIIRCLRYHWTAISKHWLIHMYSYLKWPVYKSMYAYVCVCVCKQTCIYSMHSVTILVVYNHLYRCNSFICLVSLGWSDASGISDGRTRCSSRSVCHFTTPVWRNWTQTTSLSSHTHWRGKWAILYRENHITYPHWYLMRLVSAKWLMNSLWHWYKQQKI